jgi:hypothetical protein
VITQDRLKELFTYVDGQFVCNKTGKVKNETPINNGHRYKRLVVDGRVYPAHRLIFLYHHGFLPKVVDHIDNDRSNNKIENLRSVSQLQNCLNRIKHKNNKSGYKNVFWQANCKKWSVSLSCNKKKIYFGLFDDLELASFVAEEARNKFHGIFARS